jgi:hypothetical protein
VSKGVILRLVWLKKRAVCSQFDLSVKVLYLRPNEYWLHLIHTIKGLEISLSICTEYTMLYDKAVLIKPASHPNPSLRTAQIFPDLQLLNWSLNKEMNVSCHLSGDHCSFSCSSSSYHFFPFLLIKFCYYFTICVSIQFSVQVTQELGIFWTSVLDLSFSSIIFSVVFSLEPSSFPHFPPLFLAHLPCFIFIYNIYQPLTLC